MMPCAHAHETSAPPATRSPCKLGRPTGALSKLRVSVLASTSVRTRTDRSPSVASARTMEERIASGAVPMRIGLVYPNQFLISYSTAVWSRNVGSTLDRRHP